MDAVYVNELNFGLYILKACNQSYQTHIKNWEKMHVINKKNNLNYLVEMYLELHFHFSAKAVKQASQNIFEILALGDTLGL